MNKVLVPLMSVVACVCLLGFQATNPAKEIKVTPFKASGIYYPTESVGWVIEGSDQTIQYELRENNYRELEKGEINLRGGKGKIEFKANAKACMVFLKLTPNAGKAMDFGAAINPLQLKLDTTEPADFDEFWNRKKSELRAIPPEPKLTPRQSPAPDVDYGTIELNHVSGTKVHGQWAKPKGTGKFPAVLILQWASPPYPLDPWWVVGRAKEGWLALNIEPHNVLPTEPPSYYQSLPETLKNYTGINQQDLENNYFVEMYLRGVRAVDYLASRPDWNGQTLLVMGTSMGGQQSLAVAGLCPQVTHMIVNVPAGCDMNAPLHGRQMGYPNYPDQDPKAMTVARYLDCAIHAKRIKATSLVGMGFVDTTCPPAGIWMAYNAIQGSKEAVPMMDSPHNHLATPQQQAPINNRINDWMSALVKGEKVSPQQNFNARDAKRFGPLSSASADFLPTLVR